MAEEVHQSQHSSPLEPLKNSFTLLKVIGWPLKFVNKQCTEVRRRNWALAIFWAIWFIIFAGVEFTFFKVSGFSFNETEVILRKENIRSWDEKGLWILFVPNWIRPFPMLYFYNNNDVDSKMTALLRDFVLLGIQLPKGAWNHLH